MSALEIASRLQEIYAGEPWFGESLQTKLKTVTVEMAYRQPIPNKHSIAELLSHMEYWRTSFIHQLKRDSSTPFSGESPDNWRPVKELKKQGWQNQLNSFDETHHLLVSLLRNSPDNSIPVDLISNLAGLVDHDVYHIGQIGFVKSLVLEESHQLPVSIA